MLKALSIFWNHKVGVVFFLFLVTLIGIFSALKIEKTMYPNTSLPQYSITASWGNYSPEVIELKLTAPIERAVAKLKYVKGIQSTSRRGTSQVTVFCDKNYHDKEFELLINEQLRDLRDNFSRNVNMRMSRSKPDEQGNRTSFLSYRIFSSYSIDSLSRIVENDIQSALSSIQGVSEVNVNGLEKQAYFITIKREFRNMRQFSQRVVQQRISDYFQLKKNAIVEMDNNEFIIKFDENTINYDELKTIPIAKLDNRVITLDKLAFINRGPEIKRSLIRFNGLDGISLDIKRQPDASAISTSELVQAKMDELAAKYKLTPQLLTDEGKNVEKKLDDLFLRVVISLIVIFVIVFIITKQLYNSVVVMLLLLLSALFAIFGLYITGNSINLTTIAGLALGFGMIIDNSLVVVEKLAHLQDDTSYKEKVIYAVDTILIPVKVATYTTIGAILPVYVMDEILKITLSPFVIALSFSLIASLLISVVFLPLLVKQSKRDAADALTEKDNRFTHFILWLGKKKKTSLLIIALLLGIPGIPFYYFPFPNQIPELEWYNNVFNTDTFKDKIKPAINYTFGGAPYVYINDLKDKFSWGAFRTLGDEEEKRLRLFIRGPSGMRLEDMNAIMGDFEQAVQPFIKVVDHAYVSVFAGGASMEIFFDDDHYYDGTPEKIKDKLAEKTVNFGGLDLFISGVGDNIFIRGAGRGGFASGEGALRYKLTGPSYNGLKEFAQQIEKFLEENRRVKNIEINASGAFRGGSQDQMELTYHTRMEPYEYEWIGNNMQNLLSRDETEFSVPGVLGEERIYIKSESQTLATVDDFNSLVFENDSLIPISLETLGDLKEEEIQSDITREDQLYVRLVSFEYRAAKKQIDRFKVNFEQWLSLNKPEDIRAKEDLNENTFAFEEGMDTWVVILITLLIVFAIVAMYFESYKYAAAIFLIVPFSLVGIIYFFFAMDEAIDSDAVFGLMFVAGIVINNAAFVIYEILRKRREGVEMNEALESTVIDRFRPVMLTTITTIIGILPLFLPQILAQVLDDYTIAYLSYYLPESISDFMFKNTNTDPMWYAMSLSIISGTTASFFFSLWVPVVVFYRRSKKRLIGTAAALIKTDS